MIRQNELRVGNWIKDPLDQYVQVFGILDHIQTKYDGGTYWSFDPIPLTPEILEATGFRKFGNEFSIQLKSGVDLVLDNDGHFNIFLKQTDVYDKEDVILMPTEISAVHQLQNLYFALTRTELNIDLNDKRSAAIKVS